MTTLDEIFNALTGLGLWVAIAIMLWTTATRIRGDRAQLRTNKAVHDHLGTLGRRIDNLTSAVNRIDAENIGYREMLDHPLVRPAVHDRWGGYDAACERLRAEIDAIETDHREARDTDKHEPGS